MIEERIVDRINLKTVGPFAKKPFDILSGEIEMVGSRIAERVDGRQHERAGRLELLQIARL